MSKYTTKLIGLKVKSVRRSKTRTYCKLQHMSPGKFKVASPINPNPQESFQSLNDKDVWFVGDHVVHRKGKALKGKEIYEDLNTWNKE